MRDVALASRREWLLADGLGGWAASTVLGLNTRGGHGLLVTAAAPPYPRLVLLSRVEEAVTCDGVRHDLGTNDYGNALHPRGFERADAFVLDPAAHPHLGGRGPPRVPHRRAPSPRAGGGARLHARGRGASAELEVRPLLAYREPGARQRENTAVQRERHADRARSSSSSPTRAVRRSPCAWPGATWQGDGLGTAGSTTRDGRRRRPGGRGPLQPRRVSAPAAAGHRRPPSRPGRAPFPVRPTPWSRVAGERRRIRALGDANEGLVPDLRRAADAFIVRAPGAGRARSCPGIPRA